MMSITAVILAITELSIMGMEINNTIARASKLANDGSLDEALTMLEDARSKYSRASDAYRDEPNPNG